MGRTKEHRPVLARYGLDDDVQALTGASTGTTIRGYGVTTIASTGNGTAANLVYTLASPVNDGVRKLLLVDNASTKLVQIRTATSTETFFGTTANAFSWSTGSTELPGAVELLSITTAQWAVTSLGTLALESTAAVTREVTILGATA